MNVSGVEFGRFFEEPETGVSVDDVLDERHEVFRHQPPFPGLALRQDEDELTGLVVVRGRQPAPEVGELAQVEALALLAPGGAEDDPLPVDRISASLETRCKIRTSTSQ